MKQKKMLRCLVGIILVVLLAAVAPVNAGSINNTTRIGTSEAVPYDGDGISDAPGAYKPLTDFHNIISNSSTIYVTGTGIATDSGTINNSGTIFSRDDYAIETDDGNDRVDNSGIIKAQDAVNDGIYLGTGHDRLFNSGVITILDAGGHGIQLEGGNDILQNTGTITVKEAYNSGIAFCSGDDILENSGTISIGETSCHGIIMGSGNDRIINTGTINIDFVDYHGIKFPSDDNSNNSITNSGTINIEYACCHGFDFGSGATGKTTIDNSGLINIGFAGKNGFRMTSGDDHIINSGTINIDHACSNGIAATSGTFTLENSGTITIGQVDCAGIKTYGDFNDTITNSGIITVKTTNYNGITLCSGNDTINNSGTINIDYVNSYSAINMASGDDTINNSGTINIGVANHGIKFASDVTGDVNTVNNSGTINIDHAECHGFNFGSSDCKDTINNSGEINIDYAGKNGIRMASGDDTIINSGTIYIGTAGCQGISLGGGSGTLENSGTITIDSVGCAGISSYDDNDTLTNSGTITIKQGCMGIKLCSGDDILNNSGTIDIGNMEWFGINMASGNDQIINSGTINIESAYHGFKYYSDNDSTVTTTTNSGTINIGYACYHGFNFGSSGSEDNVTNSGEINIDFAGRNGFRMASGDDTITNSGTLTIGMAVCNGLAMSYDDDTVENTGTMNITAGCTAINLGDDDDTMISTGILNLSAPVAIDGDSGDDTLRLGGTHTATIDGDIEDFETFTKEGTGTWTLNGDVEADDLIVEAGRLYINGELDGNDVLVDGPGLMSGMDGGTLGGSGEIIADVMNSGTVAPGNSIGTLTIDGDYDHDFDAILDIEVGTTGDRLDVTGTATIAGGDVNVTPVGVVENNAEYEILTAGTLDGRFDDINESSCVLDFDAVYTVTDLTLTASRTAYAALYPGQASLGQALNREINSGDTTGPLADLIVALDNAASVSELGGMLNSVAPGAGADLGDIGFDNLGQFQNLAANRLNGLQMANASGNEVLTARMTESGPIMASAHAAAGRGMGVWMEGFGATGDQDNDGVLSGYDYDTKGIVLGMDKLLGDNIILGVSGGMADTDVDYNTSGTEQEIDAMLLNLYGSYQMDDIIISSVLSYADNEYDSKRTLPAVGLLSSDHDGTDMSFSVNAGYLMTMGEMNVIPNGGLEYALHDGDVYTEYDNTGTAFMQVDELDTDSMKSRLGVRFNRMFAVGDAMQLLGQMRLQWAHEFADTEREVTARFVGSTGSFTVQGVEPERDSIGCGMDLVLDMNQALKLNFNLDGEWRDGFTAYGLAGGLRYEF